MKFGRFLGFGFGPRHSEHAQTPDSFPEVNAFVELRIGNSSGRQSVAINAVTASHITTQLCAGMSEGAAADFLYVNSVGKFRFSTVCLRVDADQAFFGLPSGIKVIESFADRRTDMRVACVIPVQWRYAPGGKGFGEFLSASMMDLSRGGASLVVGRELKVGSQVEVRFTLKSKSEPVNEVCQVMRAAKIETSDRNAAGIRFVEIDPGDAEMLSTFVHERQTQRRDRGVV